jgi:aldehyde:ferredoxin oxidoreductase
MPFSYSGKILHVDLSSGAIAVEEPDDLFYRRYLGGKGFAGYYLLKMLRPGVDPLGPDNVLVFAPGLLCGTPGPGLNRFTVAAKSPLSGAYGEAEAGGWWGPELKFAGFDAIVIKGRAAQPVYLWLEDGRAEVRDARHLWGLTTGEAQEAIRQELGEGPRKVRIAQIGPAGENRVRFACVVSELRYFNGRGGLGAVMGSKNLKAVAVRGSQEPALADPEAVLAIVRWHAKEFKNDPRGAALHAAGTPGLVAGLNAAGLLPTHNFQSGAFAGAEALSYDAYKTLLAGTNTCHACPVRCKREVSVTGAYAASPLYGGPEYETIAALGSNCGLGDLRVVAAANELCARYTLDSISTGVAIAFAMECFERGLLTRDDVGGLDLRFGNAEAMLQLVTMIAYRQGIGDLLAEGVRRAAARIGHGAEALAMHVKGQELPLHEPRGKFGVGLGFAVSETGADHLKMVHDTVFQTKESASLLSAAPLGLWEPLDARDASSRKVRLYRLLENGPALWNCLGACFFIYAPRGFFPLERVPELVQAITGWRTSLGELWQGAERAINLARVFNVREGFGRADDTLPPRLFQPLEGGRLQGASLSREEFAAALTLLYQMKGWDPATAAPTRAKLAELDIEWAAEEIAAK